MDFVDALDAPNHYTPVRSMVDGMPWHASCANAEGEPAQVARLGAAHLDCHGCGDEI